MGRTPKTPKFVAFNSFANCFGERQTGAGKWQKYRVASTEKPLILEIGCARAELLLSLAREYPDKNFIGVDKKSDRMYFPAKLALQEKINNIAFIQTDTIKLTEYIDESSVDAIWLTFPDPYPRDKGQKHRMTNRKFLDVYHKILKKGGVLHFKTDNKKLFDWSKTEIIASKLFKIDFISQDLHKEQQHEEAKILTVYEKKFQSQGLTTKYLKAVKE